jgi:hypothetical protein
VLLDVIQPRAWTVPEQGCESCGIDSVHPVATYVEENTTMAGQSLVSR